MSSRPSSLSPLAHGQANAQLLYLPPATIAAVHLKLPPFWPADLAIWFTQVESQFATRNITQLKTRFHYVIAALDPEVAAKVRDLVLHLPEDAPHDKLRSELIKRTEALEQRRLQQLLTAKELDDRKLTQLLWCMKTVWVMDVNALLGQVDKPVNWFCLYVPICT